MAATILLAFEHRGRSDAPLYHYEIRLDPSGDVMLRSRVDDLRIFGQWRHEYRAIEIEEICWTPTAAHPAGFGMAALIDAGTDALRLALRRAPRAPVPTRASGTVSRTTLEAPEAPAGRVIPFRR